ncbi:MAG: hypothetical protein F4X66_03515 [Chloroflexi bacterium]|nr:hypothetical protein [Chloroflexota bacterium]
MAMKKRDHVPIDTESPWFIYFIVPLASGGLGLPLSIAWLMEAGGDWPKIAIGLSPILGCALIGFSLVRIITWLTPLREED